ncbi:serine protease [Mumia flava]|uniref:Serine protease n=1 Tax=Mumia flava TaxID=1348852 RepID=A0A2M9BJY7_9ACTN|nr:S8 family peptidase [Mumia flava]PJJ58265.1 serine protease [Mumia flava]
MSSRTRIVGAAAAALLIAGLAPASAEPSPDAARVADPAPAAETAAAKAGDVRVDTDTAPDQVGGLIVTYDDTAVRSGLRTATRRGAAAAGVSAEDTTVAITDDVDAVRFDQPVTEAEATEAAEQVADLDGVASVELDRMRTIAAAPVPNDPQFSAQWNIRGTYGTHANAAWPATRGRSSVVVAVIDTGRSAHPDLDAGTVAGYDMISSRTVARDGNGRDPNPRDEGDWYGANVCAPNTPARTSSWHGTHVAGIVAARTDNGIGIAGNAPGIRIQHVRALGRCGGYDSDIAAAIRWAAGVKVPGTSRNRTPAKVINLSLGGRANYCPSTYRSAIAAARSRGATVVVAAGNENINTASFTPANCAGAVVVAATNPDGKVAAMGNGVPYSNFGAAVDLSAPGGDAILGRAVLSTMNTSDTTPGNPTYAQDAGTSMAAPAVSAAAALIRSHGAYSPAVVEQALKGAVRPFPSTSGGTRCVPADCGTGILDLSRLPLSTKAPAARGRRAVGATLTTNRGSWIGGPTSFSYGWTRDGRAIAGARGARYVIKPSDAGSVVRARVAGRRGAVAPLWRASNGFSVPKLGSRTGLAAKPKRARYGRTKVKLVARVKVGAGAVKGKVVLRDGKKKIGKAKLKRGKAVVRLGSRKLRRGKHRITATFVPANARSYKRSTSKKVVVRVR